nr:SKP1-like protein 1B [Tanacetum cinerariifolium]
MEFQVEDKVMLKVSPWKGVVRFDKRGKLNPRYVGPYKSFRWMDFTLMTKLHLVDELVEIVDREVKRLKRSRIPLVKVKFDGSGKVIGVTSQGETTRCLTVVGFSDNSGLCCCANWSQHSVYSCRDLDSPGDTLYHNSGGAGDGYGFDDLIPIMSSSSKMILLKSSDGQTFKIEESAALQSKTIKHMIEDGCAGFVIPTPNITGKILSKVIEYCNKHAKTSKKGTNKVTAEELKAFDAEFVKVDLGTLFDIILAHAFFSFLSFCS